MSTAIASPNHTARPRVTLRLADSPERPALRSMELFAGIADHDLDLLESRLGMVRWPQGAETPAPLERVDQVFLVREGRIGLFEQVVPGHEVMIAILDPGSVWTTVGLTRAPTVCALDSAAVSPLPSRAIEALSARYPRLARNLTAALSDRLTMLAQTVAIVSEMRVEDRLRSRMHQLAERFGTTARDGIRLELDLTHAQWASLVGA